MSDVTTTVRELRRDDMVCFPDGKGGQVWAPVIRTLPGDGHLVEIMFGTAARPRVHDERWRDGSVRRTAVVVKRFAQRVRLAEAAPSVGTAPSRHTIGSRAPVNPDLTETQREVLEALRSVQQPVAGSALLPLTGLEPGVARRALADLRELGLASADWHGQAHANLWTSTP